MTDLTMKGVYGYIFGSVIGVFLFLAFIYGIAFLGTYTPPPEETLLAGIVGLI